ncbi:MAG: DinB family protein [Alphaproteobacteria bacterium]
MDPLVAHFQRMAAYNEVANQRLYAAVARLPPAEFVRERPAFFGSIRGVLNHILVGDRIWLARFEGRVVPSTGLDAMPFPEFADLREARAAEDARIRAFADRLTPAALAGEIRHVDNEGRDMADPVAVLVAHFFNHQTHHRGQAHDLLSQTSVALPVLDLHRCLNP